MRKYLLLPLLMFVSLSSMTVTAQDTWTRFRGPNGTGISDLEGVPTEWETSDYEWVVDLPGKGHSSPCVWKDRIFLTAGNEDGSRMLICLDAFTGQQRWTKTTQLAANHLHWKNSYGSTTPVTDGERVYVTEADGAHYVVKAFSLDGDELWSRDLGPYESQHGFGSSPVIYDDLVIVTNDQIGPSSIEALDVKTGRTRWKTTRAGERASYATPIILNLDGQDQLVALSSAVGLAGLDLSSGRELWASGRLPQRTVASPIFANGLLIASCGQGGRGVEMIAVDPTQSQQPQSLIREVRKKSLPYVPTPVVQGQYLFLWNDDGVVSCVDMQDGLNNNVWRERIGGNYSGSPVIIGGKIYCISEEGEVKVLDASPKFREYPGGSLGDQSYSTPAVANGRVYLRGFHTLASLKAR